MKCDARSSASIRVGGGISVGAAVVWMWALALLSTRDHLVDFYEVLATAPEAWGFIVLPIWRLIAILAGGIFWAWLGLHQSCGEACGPPSSRWLLGAGAIPALDLLRWAGLPLAPTFFEPLWLSFVTGMAASRGVASGWSWRGGERACFAAVLGLASAAASWWYWEAAKNYEDFLLGYHDFGHFAIRVINTWEGRGWLLETPSLPAFWDHFNPGLVLLAPLWGLWPDARLFLVLQTLCLALPALLAYGIARRFQTSPALALVWSAVYLGYPCVGLLNLSYSYGWHPVSLALPLLFLSVWLLLGGRRVAALLALVVACSFKQTVIVVAGCLAAGLAVQRWGEARRLGSQPGGGSCRRLSAGRLAETDSAVENNAARQTTAGHGRCGDLLSGVWGDPRLAKQLPLGGWLALWASLLVAFGMIVTWAPFTEFQTGRFTELGDSGWEILCSPVLRPAVFWGQWLRPVVLYFLLALLVPWHLPTLLRGGPLLLATVLPLAILVAWPHGPATSIAFQYVTEMILVFWLAALCGATRTDAQQTVWKGRAEERGDGKATAAACGALAASLTASWLFGSLPWSGSTLTLMQAQTYAAPVGNYGVNPRAVGTPGHALLRETVSRVNQPEAAVLATGRIAAHLLHVRRLESVEQALVRWPALGDEAGPGRSPLEVFDWIVLDLYEQFQQSGERTARVREEAHRIGYRKVLNREGLIVFQRPAAKGED